MQSTDAPFRELMAFGLACMLAACSSSNDSKSTNDGGKTTGSAGSCSGKTGKPGSSTLTLAEPDAPDAGIRSALVHVPPSYDATKPTMLVLNLHGLLEPAALQESVSHMSDTADADPDGFIVVYPVGLKGGVGVSWDAGSCCGNPYDDVAFIRDLVKKLEAEYCVDPKRVFVTGLSNGAMMSYRLGCEASDVFAAIAPVAGAVEVPDCKPGRPVPVLAFHGTGDTIVPFNGGTDGLYHVLKFPPVSYSIDLFRSLDGCPASPAPDGSALLATPNASTPDGGPSDTIFEGSTSIYAKGDAACHRWSGCSAGSEVELCTIVDGGHAWPGGGPLVGKTSHDIDATQTIIDFFKRHPMP